MAQKNSPLQQKLMTVILMTSGAVLLLTCISLFAFEFYSFRNSSVEQLSTLGKIIATNSTAALAFEDSENANETLTALEAEPHIVAAALYNEEGRLFAHYPAGASADIFPATTGAKGYRFYKGHIEGFQPVLQKENYLGVLFLRSDMKAMNERFALYGFIVLAVVIVSVLLAYFLSKRFQHRITKPILALAETARIVASDRDYSLRADSFSRDEIGGLSKDFNSMLETIEEMEQSLKEANADLEERVKERTIQLETTNKDLESFTYSVSHDLRAPLRIINAYADILAEEHNNGLDEEGKRLTAIIVRNAKRMGRLIDDLLNISRFGRANLQLRKVDMGAMVSAVIEEQLQEMAPENPPQINVRNLHNVVCDFNLMRQVWINLISNAIKYSSKKEKPLIEIGSYPQGNEIVYFVRDNGAGFDMQYANKLFGVFQRLHKSTDFEGTGIGLAIVFRIVAKHQGKVWAEAAENLGATFYFSIPDHITQE